MKAPQWAFLTQCSFFLSIFSCLEKDIGRNKSKIKIERRSNSASVCVTLWLRVKSSLHSPSESQNLPLFLIKPLVWAGMCATLKTHLANRVCQQKYMYQTLWSSWRVPERQGECRKQAPSWERIKLMKCKIFNPYWGKSCANVVKAAQILKLMQLHGNVLLWKQFILWFFFPH